MDYENTEEMADQVKIGPYTQRITSAMVVLGEAVALAMNMRDRPVIEEMERVTADIFRQANEALNSDPRNVQ